MAIKQQRYISRLTRDTFALILAGGKGSRLHELTDWRAKPSVYFGGKFRIIDFPLSNCINSNIRRVAVLTQYKAHSLITHVIRGWTYFRRELGEFVEVWPASQRTSENWYSGTADAIYQNIDVIRDESPEYILVLSGDHIYKMDYGTMLAAHADLEADLTISCIEVPISEAANRYGVLTVDENFRVTAFTEKPAEPTPLPGQPDMCLASMGNYVFNRDFLFEQVTKDADDPKSEHDFGKNIIPSIISKYRVFAFPFRDPDSGLPGYWRDVGTLDAYYEANMELVSVVPELNIYDENWPILTYQPQLPPAKFVFDRNDRRGMAVDSMISPGCVISGATIRRSLLFSGVTAHSYCKVTDTVVMPGVDIGRGAIVNNAIIDRGCRLPPKTRIGIDPKEDRSNGFRLTEKGRVLVTPDMLGQNLHVTR
ncbi:MAG: glucose-1-phosphate adenylyltransferase [Pseudomonadota bacterium]